MGAPCWQHSFICKRRSVLPFDVVPKLLVVLPFHFNLFWQSLHATVPAPLFFSKCFRTDDELADDSSIAKTGFFLSISGCFAHALVARIIRIMKRSSNIDGRILLFEYSIYSFHPYLQWKSILGKGLLSQVIRWSFDKNCMDIYTQVWFQNQWQSRAELVRT